MTDEKLGYYLVDGIKFDSKIKAALHSVKIKKKIHIPLVADIHFDHKLALECAAQGIDKIRINPGNIGSKEKVAASR